ncbi:hypothetical protein [Nocardia sp. NBC_01327]|uniref:hypothetical protein n=1 Tax=Nocardia sp. NBC_01327 TaxID=2903593 RepID=UPI002E13A203|nr:hypothetical protein OG326_28010 [Nocardia sp. NBC_01327]
MSAPSAIGYLRHDISKARQVWDEAQIRSVAARLGYDLRKTVVFGPHTDRPDLRLRTVVSRLGVDAVVTPSLAHLGGEVPDFLAKVCDVITVDPETTYARSANDLLPDSGGA